MERAFLFGLGTFLVIAGLGLLLRLSIPAFILALVLMPIGVVLLRDAIHAPPNRSRASAIGGWLLGFLSIPVLLSIGVGVFSILQYLQ
jgi:ABC-type phosphate transport system permease subunit